MNRRFVWWLIAVILVSGLSGALGYIVVTESGLVKMTEDALGVATGAALVVGITLYLYALARGGAPYKESVKDESNQLLRRLG